MDAAAVDLSLGSLRPPSPVALDEDPSSNTNTRSRAQTPAGLTHQLELKRKNYNHAKVRLERKYKIFYGARDKYHNLGHLVEEYASVRLHYDQLVELRAEFRNAALGYLNATPSDDRERLREVLQNDLDSANSAINKVYLAVSEDRAYERRRARMSQQQQNPINLAGAMSAVMAAAGASSSANQENNDDLPPLVVINRTGASGAPSSSTTTDTVGLTPANNADPTITPLSDQQHTPSSYASLQPPENAADLPSTTGQNSGSKAGSTKSRTSKKSSSSGKRSGSGASTASSVRLRREEERARLELERLKKLAAAEEESAARDAKRKAEIAHAVDHERLDGRTVR